MRTCLGAGVSCDRDRGGLDCLGSFDRPKLSALTEYGISGWAVGCLRNQLPFERPIWAFREHKGFFVDGVVIRAPFQL